MHDTNLREKVVKGVAWSAFERWGGEAISSLIIIVLARLLGPEEFGLIGYANVFIALVHIVLDQGLSEAVIQRVELEDTHLDTAFWMNIFAGATLTLLGIIFASLISRLFREPELQPIVAWLSLSFLISAFNRTQVAILRRNLSFKSLSQRTIIANSVSGVLGILAALLGFGVWSLVIQRIMAQFVAVFVLWRVSGWRPRARFSLSHFRDLFSFGIQVLGTRTLVYLDQQSDRFLIGYFLNTTTLGLYHVARSQIQRIINVVSGVTTQVALPTFAQLQTDQERLRRIFFKATNYTSLFSFPLFTVLVIAAPEIIVGIFGPQWEQSIPVFRIFGLSGVFLTALPFCGQLMTAMGFPERLLRIRFILTSARILGFMLAYKWGIEAVAGVYTATTILIAPAYLLVAQRTVAFSLKQYLKQYTAAVTGSIAIIITIFITKLILGDQMSPLWQLAILLIVSMFSYICVVKRMQPGFFTELMDMLQVMRTRAPASS